MKFANVIAEKFSKYSLPTEVSEDGTKITIYPPEQECLVVEIDNSWQIAFEAFSKLNNPQFNVISRSYTYRNYIEIPIIRLNYSYYSTPDDLNFIDTKGNKVSISLYSMNYAFAFLDTPLFDEQFKNIILPRLYRRKYRRIQVVSLFMLPMTATYQHKGRSIPPDLNNIALSAINRTLCKMAIELGEPFVVSTNKIFKARLKGPGTLSNNSIPRANYDEKVVSYYKLAKATPFPSQSFLAYYHVLEYYFLTVSELVVHDRLSSIINSPSFSSTREQLDKVIAAVRLQDNKNDETEMLRAVLDRYVSEAELIDFIGNFETGYGSYPYTKARTIFGVKDMQISNKPGHAVANTARTLKFIRNAIVHSSDRYQRDERHIPFSESENCIEEYLPLVRFIAERVIFGTAS